MEPREPVTALDHLDVEVLRPGTDQVKVTLVDVRCGLRLLALDPSAAVGLANRLTAAASRAGWPGAGGPG